MTVEEQSDFALTSGGLLAATTASRHRLAVLLDGGAQNHFANDLSWDGVPTEVRPPMSRKKMEMAKQKGSRVSSRDVGCEAIDGVYAALGLGEQWSVREERGFTWWGTGFAQHVHAAAPVHERGLDLHVLTSVTPLVRGVTPSDEVARLLTFLNALYASLSAFVLDVERGLVSLICRTKVYESPDDAGGEAYCEASRRLFGLATALQVSQAHHTGETVATLLKSDPARSHHPGAGTRTIAHEIAEGMLPKFADEGQKPSVWRGDEMQAAKEAFQQFGALTIGDENGVSATVPFLEDSALVTMSTKEQHAQLGSGLQIRLVLPLKWEMDSAATLAALMNQMEGCGQPTFTAFMGGWCASPQNMPAFVAFYPNVLFGRDYAGMIALEMMMRARWAAGVVAEFFEGLRTRTPKSETRGGKRTTRKA
jgi:hypothetical protein